MKTFLKNGIILTPDESVHGKILVVENGKIIDFIPNDININENQTVVDASGCWIIPGMIDLHVHGAKGFDTMDASMEAIQTMGKFFARHGVTSYLPTTMSMSKEAIMKAVENVAHCPQPSDGAQHQGVHLEGPYLNSEYRGAQESIHLRPADPVEYLSWFRTNLVKLITLAPEINGANELLAAGIEKGIEFSVGHSKATFDQVNDAIELGLRQASHTFNGMSALHHREPGVLGAILSDDRLFAQVIPDGIHVHPVIVKLLIKVKGVERTILISDAIRATGLEDGFYNLGSQEIRVEEGIPRTSSGNLAGSTLTMDQALRNAIEYSGLSLQEGLPMCTSVPANAMGWSPQKGNLVVGADADIVLLNQQLRVCLTMISGKIVFQQLDNN